MEVSGSFKIPRFEVMTQEHVKTITADARLRARYVFVKALLAYFVAAAELIPVLTGTTKGLFLEICDHLDDELRMIESRHQLEAPHGNDFDMEVPDVEKFIVPTGRQWPGSPVVPSTSPMSADRPYKWGITYRGRRYMSRAAWRAAAIGNTKGSVLMLLRPAWANQYGGMYDFDFKISMTDDKPEYYPEVYETLGAVAHVYEEALAMYYPRFVLPFVQFHFVEGA